MKNRPILTVAAILLCSSVLIAQVQVSKEPRHKKVLENKYIRLLDVWLQPGDTTLFHIHSTPSVFLQFTNTAIAIQVKGQDWVKINRWRVRHRIVLFLRIHWFTG